MTREMKIGLLLSLGIVIVVFVLLSDQVVSTDVRPAVVTQAGPLVHEATATPGGASAAMAGPVQIDNKVEPGQPVTTVQELTPRPASPGVSVVDVGPVQNGTIQVTSSANNNVPTNARVTSLDTTNQTSPNTLVTPIDPRANSATPPTPEAPKAKEYKAIAGDTVAKMARTFYGSDTKANRELIINANKAALKADPSKVVVGKVYLIPTKASPAPAPAAVAPTTRPAAELAAAAPAAATTLLSTSAARESAPAERFYVVKTGDNLWKIAKEQCKNSNAVDEIKKLNRDQLKGGNDLKIGMKLKLPPVM